MVRERGGGMKLLKQITKTFRCYEILLIDEDNRTFKKEDDIKWLLETDIIYLSEKGRLKVLEYDRDYNYIGSETAEIGDYIVQKGYHEDGEPIVKLLKRHIADVDYEVIE